MNVTNRAHAKLINYRPMFEIAVGLVLGIAVCGSLSSDGVTVLGILFLIFCAAAAFFGRRRFAFFIGSIFLGLALVRLSLPADIDDGNYSVNGIVNDVFVSDEGAEITLTSVKIDGRRLNKKLLLTVDGEYVPDIGDELSAEAYVRTPDRHFGTYDERLYYLSIGIGMTASADEVTVCSSGRLPITRFLHGIRDSVSAKAIELFGSDGPIISAITVGERRELPEERYGAYRITGTAHLLAISGFHMGIIAAAIGALIPKGRRLLRAVLIGAVMFLYCGVSVYAPGLVRAAVMTFCMLLCTSLERRHDSLSALSLAAVLLLAANPFRLYSIGFRLSFSACLGIILLGAPLRDLFKRIHIPFSSALSVSLSAILATMPFQMRSFGTVSTYSVIGNLIAVPAFSIVQVFSLAAVLLGFVLPGAASVLAYIPRAVLFVLERLLAVLAELPAASIGFKPLPELSCVLFLITLFAASRYILRPREKRMKLALIMLAAFTSLSIIGIILT